MRELSVIGVRVELPTNQPIVLLREVEGDRYLPIWIGAVEATAIAYEQQGVKPARPLTHDLLRDLLEALSTPLKAVEIVELRDSIFYADLLLGEGGQIFDFYGDLFSRFGDTFEESLENLLFANRLAETWGEGNFGWHWQVPDPVARRLGLDITTPS